MTHPMVTIPLLLAVIGTAFIQPTTWAAVIQASIASFSLGIQFMMIMDDRERARKVRD
jgi:hypothetical protein